MNNTTPTSIEHGSDQNPECCYPEAPASKYKYIVEIHGEGVQMIIIKTNDELNSLVENQKRLGQPLSGILDYSDDTPFGLYVQMPRCLDHPAENILMGLNISKSHRIFIKDLDHNVIFSTHLGPRLTRDRLMQTDQINTTQLDPQASFLFAELSFDSSDRYEIKTNQPFDPELIGADYTDFDGQHILDRFTYGEQVLNPQCMDWGRLLDGEPEVRIIH